MGGLTPLLATTYCPNCVKVKKSVSPPDMVKLPFTLVKVPDVNL